MIPKLRFPEFTDTWSQEDLGNIYSHIRNGFVGTATPFYVSKGHKYVQGKDVKNGIINSTVNVFVSDDFYLKNRKSILKVNDIVMVQSGHVGECAVVDASMAGANCHALIVMTPSKPVESRFYVYYFHSPSGKKKILKIKTGNTIEHILASDMKVLSTPYCSPKEQQKIADFLTTVDEKIASIYKKVELLKQYKKGVMQKIFTQQIRFKDEDGQDYPEWDEKLLSEVTERITKRNKDDTIKNVLTNSAVQGIVSQNDFFEKNIANQNNLANYYIVSSDDFVYNPRISAHAPVGPIKRNHLSIGVMSPLYSVFRFKKGVLDFYEKYFETKYWHDYMKSVANSGARHDRMNITNTDLYDLPLPFPRIDEQQKIANFLSAIDDKIKAEEIKRTSAKKFKKALLQRMFV